MATLGAKETYLILYNSLCCLGWANVWCLAVLMVVTGVAVDGLPLQVALSNVYVTTKIATLLNISQIAAVMEIVHALTGLVRSPVMVTTMQVGSRLVALLALVYSVQAQSQWGAGLMILSWSSVEVPRYAFYVAGIATGDSTKQTPYALFWLRYSLFALLYPTGICGELTVFWKAAHDPAFIEQFSTVAFWVYARLLPVIYLFGSPFMILNMAGNRKSAFKKRFAKAPPPPRGLVWPVDKQGERSSTDTNKAIVAAAVGAVNPDKEAAIMACKKWRFQYQKHLRALVEEQCRSPKAALDIAQAGLAKAYELFEFVGPDGTAVSLEQAMSSKSKSISEFAFYTGFVQGEKPKDVDPVLQVPYKGQTLSGQALKDQIQKWVDYGTIEPSAGDAMKMCVDNPAWIKNVQSRYFVLLGAGSAMGPLLVLLAAGANVVAIDLDRPQIWKRLITLAKESSGSITFPLKKEQKACTTDDELYAQAGCNLFSHTPIIRDWLLDLYPGKPFTVGSYAYLDGALHVQVSLAMDAICRDLSEKRPQTSLAYLCTPTDLHLIPKEAHEAQKKNLQEYSKKPYCIFLRLLNSGKFLRPNPKPPVRGEDGEEYFLVNGISVAQGPNYALAKRLQHWRAIVARSKNQCIVSSNIAPSTSTASVVHNRTFAWAYEGMPYFKPYEIFAPETSNAVMSALLFFDLNDPGSSGHPKNDALVKNPNQIFSYGSFHGGVWRCAYEIDSIGEASVLLYFSRMAKPYLFAAGAIVAVGVAYLNAN